MQMENNEREFGRVKWVNRDKGFFFVVPEVPVPVLQRRDIFAHISQVLGRAFINLDKGSRVSYVLRRSVKTGNLEAQDIRLEKGNDHAA